MFTHTLCKFSKILQWAKGNFVFMAHLPQIDFRYRWLSEIISNALGIFDTSFAERLISEHNDLVDAFFNDDIHDESDACKQILFVWRTFYDKLVEESITVLEEGIRVNWEQFNYLLYLLCVCASQF